MRSRLLASLLIASSVLLSSCDNTTNNTATGADQDHPKDSLHQKADSDNKHTASLKEAAERLGNAERDGDSVTVESLTDSGFAITARGKTFLSRKEMKAYVASQMPAASSDTAIKSHRIYTIEKVEAGSNEPVWAGYERGTFENIATSADGKYSRKVTGPYYRSWKLVNGEWKSYHLALMAFNCEGPDCK
jgi:predicted small secreted protein